MFSVNKMISNKRSVILICSCVFIILYVIIAVHDGYQTVNARSSRLSASSPFKVTALFNNFGQPSKTYTDPTQPVSVLILTYMRSGSSLTGDILQHSPGAFYVFEPFRSLGHRNTSTFTLIYANGSESKLPFSFQEETYNALYNWFTCNISKLPNLGLMDPFLNQGIKSRMFPICFRKYRATINDQQETIHKCARQLEGICTDSPVRVIKTIRIQLTDIKKLLDDLPNLKIIHLVRDPRATLSSQAGVGMCSARRGGQVGCTNLFCKRLENDVLEEERLLKRYPNKIMPVFYEDIARHPLETSKKMYDFIGADFTPEAEAYIYNITMAGNKNNCAICTTRSNSSEHADSWKLRMKHEFINIINERCNYVIKRYDFDEFPIK